MNLDNNNLNEEIIKSKNIFPDDHRYLTFLKKVFRHEFRKNGFRRLSTPYFWEKQYFETIFWDKINDKVISLNLWNKEICLNADPSILHLKAYIEEEKNFEIQPVYNYYMSMFFPNYWDSSIEWKYYIGWDVIWENDVIIDIQNLFIVSDVLDKLWLEWQYEINVNFIWIKKEIDKYKEKLQDFYSDKKHLLTDEWLDYYENDIIKLLSSTDEDEEILAKSAPKIEKCYKKDSKKDIVRVKDYLEILKLDHNYDHTLFWDHDFNDGLIWNIKFKENQELIAKWYWFNDLSNVLWEPKEIPWGWFYVDVFKVIDVLKKVELPIKNKDKIDLFFVQLWDDAKKVVIPLSLKARDSWINTAISLWTPSMKEQMLKAQRSKAKYVVMVWLMEAKNWIFQVRNSELGTQEEVKKDDLIEYIISKIWKDSLDFYDPTKDLLN